MIRRREPVLKKGWFEVWIDDFSLPEKLVTIIWCGLPYIIWIMADSLNVVYKILISIGVWILLTLLCWWFGMFMSSGDRHWN